MMETPPTDSPWTRLSIVTVIIASILLGIVVINAYFTGFLWAASAAMLYVFFIPLIFFIDIKTKRNAYIIFIVQLLVLFPVFYILMSYASQILPPIPELYTFAFFVFASTLLLASGIVYIILQKTAQQWIKPKDKVISA